MKKTLLSIGAALLCGFGAMAQNTVVADCESENATEMGTYWYAYASANVGLQPPTTTPAHQGEVVMTAEGTNHFAKMIGTLRNTAGPGYASAGLGFPFAQGVNEKGEKYELDYDLTGATGISFKIKSSRQVNFSVMLSITKQDEGEDFSFMVPAKGEWTTVIVKFPGSTITADGTLAQPSWASLKVDWNAAKVTKLQWQVKDSDGDFDFSIDDVTILGKTLTVKRVLQQAIYEAEGAIKYADDNSEEKTPAVREALEAAITAAQAVMDNLGATQSEVDAKVTALKNATQAFKDDGPGTPATCQDPKATNPGGPLPCTYGGTTKTIKMDWNQYAPKNSAQYQAKPTLASFGVANALQVEQTVTVQIAGTANEDIDKLQIAIINDAPPAYWAVIAAYQEVGDIKAGVPFEKTLQLQVTNPMSDPKLVFDGLNGVLADVDNTLGKPFEAGNAGEGGYGKGTSITLTLTTINVTVSGGTAISTVGAANVAVKASSIEIASDKTIASVVITNVIGAQVMNQAVGAASASVSTANLQAGIYYATINFANGAAQVVKFVK